MYSIKNDTECRPTSTRKDDHHRYGRTINVASANLLSSLRRTYYHRFGEPTIIASANRFSQILRLLALVLFTLAFSRAGAQQTYQTTYGGTDITNTSIRHKQPKWVSLHEGGGYTDDFNENGWVTTESGESIQAANLYVDTIYMHKGTSTTLEVPYRKNANTAVANYVRWFDFRRDGNYYCGSASGISVTDLLTMTEFSSNGSGNGASSNNYVYRFANGYVGGWGLTNSNAPYGANFYYPTEAEFGYISGSNGSFNNGDNNYYIVACESSLYNDFSSTYTAGGGGSTFGNSNSWFEPTLSSRALFYIIGIEDDTPPEGFEHHWCLTTAEYQGGGNDVDADGNYVKKYLEEYEITFPARRTSINTNELVTLSKDPQAYAIPGLRNSSSDHSTLDVAFATGETNGLTLVNTTRTGTARVIQFYKGTSKAQWKVDDKSTATILVTKTVNGTTYNIARYKLTFREDVTPLTQTQVAGLSKLTGDEGYWWKDLTHRSPEYMETNYEKITSLTFSYDTDDNANNLLNGGMSYAYPFPLEWDYCGYAFYDGSPAADVNTTSYGSGSSLSRTQWGMYSIVNAYIGYGDVTRLSNTPPPTGTAKDDGGYWLYMDASDRPGSLAELTFDERLCQGSELFGTAWIKSASWWQSGTTDDDGAVLFTIMGVTIDEDGNEIHEPIYRQCSGQIMITNYLTSPMDETAWGSDVTGKGEGTNQWFQLYFSFVNSGNVDYERYTLKIDNYCASTGGGDYYFDEVKIYVLHPSVDVAQINPICTTDDEKTLMRIDVEYESMMSRLGYDPEEYLGDANNKETASVDFVIINKAKYYNALNGIAEPTTEQKEEAFKAALVTFYDSGGKEHQFPTLDFYLNYALNTKYDDANPGSNQVVFGADGNKDDGDEGDFYWRVTEGGLIELSVDCYTDMLAYTTYIILLEPHTETDKTDAAKLDEFIALLDDECAIKTEFYLTSTTILKINGETANPTADYCEGQTLEVAPEVTYTDENGKTINIDGVYFDWFFGTQEEFVAENEQFNGTSLQEALQAFRLLYPDAEELNPTDTPVNERVGFTEDCYNIIAHYLQQKREDTRTAQLVLHATHLDITITYTGLELVIQPIAVYTEDENGQELEICFGFVPLTLLATGVAPTLKPGLYNVNYPDDYEPCLRLGVEQFKRCGADSPFIINLHGATYASEDDVRVDHLGVAEGMSMLFLVDTDDPTYHERLLDKEDGDEIVVGKVVRLYAKDDESDDTSGSPSDVKGSYMQIYFNVEEADAEGWPLTPFAVREGYYYVLTVYFQEKGPYDEGEQTVGSACWGTFPLEMKIVPEHLVWTGDKTSNWNNDNHWRRADKSELNKAETDAYPTNEKNGTDKGFVPMLFSKVVMPSGSAAELYMAGFKEGSDGMQTWQGDEDTANHEDVAEKPTGNIMYDLMLYENPTTGVLNTGHFRVNLCDEIHFETGAQLLHSEQLIYNKAWTDVELKQGPWLLTSTPLRDVVSGDWYTKKNGRETAEYFTDITFNDDENTRLNPMVYQRNWSNENNKIVYANVAESKDVPAYVSTGWSSVYNDASVPQQAGEGISIKASRPVDKDGKVDDESNLLFRFPKADESFDVSAAVFTRTNAGRLLISDLVSREDPDGDYDDVYTGTVNVGLTQTGDAGNDYYIIGNPYTAPMSMSAFMAENVDIKGYWTESTYGPIAGGRDTNSWGTEDCLVEPYGAFFVTTDANDLTRADKEVTVKFTKDMQTEKRVSTTSLSSLSIRATGSGGTTSAAVTYADDAMDDYSAGEDAMLMEDESWKREGMPMVYSVAGEKAVSVNTLKQLTLIPIGVFANEQDLYTLTFVGVSNLDEPSLVDTYEDTETELSEGFTMEMEGATHGRYYIRVKTPTMTSVEETASPVCEVSAYSPVSRTVVVSCDAGLVGVEIYSIGGVLLRRESVGGSVSCTIGGVPSGIAIVKVKTAEGTAVKKIRVR